MRELSNMSYTNKDFNSIYAELLEYAKKISYRWDPSISDESDPAVVLLKLAAIVGDKDNYNIDKNVLELMPASVTQLGTARQLFEQCGYSMHYYKSAEGYVDITINKELLANESETLDEDTTYEYTIPQFTMFTNSDKSVVFTSTLDVPTNAKTACSIPVIEGKVVDYTVNNDPLITTRNLDTKNRLYFADSDVAENGIFITNLLSSGSTNYQDWKRVDNIELEDAETSRTYKFGMTPEDSLCYIEFSDDAVLSFNNGINIKYVKTNGSKGDVPRNRITEFYVDTKFIRTPGYDSSESEVDATIDNIKIRNSLPIIGGADPQTIDDAYKDYKRVRDTFKTLVSLKDYTDYMVTSGNASNGYVCDRTNDIQRCYKILKSGSDNYFLNVIDSNEKKLQDKFNKEYTVDVPAMNAFNLCVYPLVYSSNVSSTSEFTKTFSLFKVSNENNFFDEEDNSVKSLQHDFLGFDSNKILMLKNKYAIKANIIPKYTLSISEKNDVLYNVEKALCRALNATQMTFGQSVSLDLIKNTIINADARIKALIDFMSPVYETYAIYKDTNGEFQELRVDMASDDGGYVPVQYSHKKPDGWPTDYYRRDEQTNQIIPVVNPSDSSATENFDPLVTYYTYKSELHDLWYKFRVEIYAKNILSGVTPLYDDANDYPQTIVQQNTTEYTDIDKVTTNTDVKFTLTDGVHTSRQLTKNESILFTAPSFIEENNFSSYVKFIYKFNNNNTVTANSRYFLSDGEFIVFFYKSSSESDNYNYIKYTSGDGSPANIISPTFTMEHLSDEILSSEIVTKINSLSAGSGTVMDSTLDELIREKLNTDSGTKRTVTTGTSTISTYKINKIHINNTENGSRALYWILNTVDDDGKYTLFDSSETADTNTTDTQTEQTSNALEYTLGSGEYFMYTNENKTVLDILGEGTVITRSGAWNNQQKWSVDPIEYSELLSQGISILDDKWFRVSLSNDNKVEAQEQQLALIGEDYKVNVITSTTLDKLSNGKTNLYNSEISYEDSKGNKTTLEKIDSDTYGWSARSILSLKMSSNEPQELTGTQSITFIDEDTPLGSTCPVVNGPCFVSCDNNIEIAGGTNVSVTNIYTPYVNFLSYTIPESTTEIAPTSDFGVSVTVPKVTAGSANVEYVAPLDLVAGNYLLPVETESSNFSLSVVPVSITQSKNLLPFPYKGGNVEVADKNITIKNDTNEGYLKLTGSGNGEYEYTYTLGELTLSSGHYAISYTIEGTKECTLSWVVDGALQEIDQFWHKFSLEGTAIKTFGLRVTFWGVNSDCIIKVLLEKLADYDDIITIDEWEPYGGSITEIESPSNDITLDDCVHNYYKLSVTDSAVLYALKITNSSTDENLKLLIKQPYKYDANKYKKFANDVDSKTFEDKLIEKLAGLDPEGQFDYTYCSDTPITNPLDANMFLRSNHFYNKFTICEWDTVIAGNTVIHDIFR